MKNLILLLALMGCVFSYAQSTATKQSGPDCSGGWPTSITYGRLKNAGLIKLNEIDWSKTKTKRLVSQRIGSNLWHQVYLVAFFTTSGKQIEAIAIHDASAEECSMSGVDVYVISQHLPEVRANTF